MKPILMSLARQDARVREAFFAFVDAWMEANGDTESSQESLLCFLLGLVVIGMQVMRVERIETAVYDPLTRTQMLGVAQVVSVEVVDDALPS